jgi:hypothetical protein
MGRIEWKGKGKGARKWDTDDATPQITHSIFVL